MKTYEEFMKKAHGALILERENDIILEIRATKDYLDAKIDGSLTETNVRFDETQKDIAILKSDVGELKGKMTSIESKLDRLIELQTK